MKGKSAIVQGLGNVGFYAAHFISKAGAKIVAIAEYNGGVANADGLNVEECYQYFKLYGTFNGYTGGRFIQDPMEVFYMTYI